MRSRCCPGRSHPANHGFRGTSWRDERNRPLRDGLARSSATVTLVRQTSASARRPGAVPDHEAGAGKKPRAVAFQRLGRRNLWPLNRRRRESCAPLAGEAQRGEQAVRGGYLPFRDEGGSRAPPRGVPSASENSVNRAVSPDCRNRDLRERSWRAFHQKPHPVDPRRYGSGMVSAPRWRKLSAHLKRAAVVPAREGTTKGQPPVGAALGVLCRVKGGARSWAVQSRQDSTELEAPRESRALRSAFVNAVRPPPPSSKSRRPPAARMFAAFRAASLRATVAVVESLRRSSSRPAARDERCGRQPGEVVGAPLSRTPPPSAMSIRVRRIKPVHRTIEPPEPSGFGRKGDARLCRPSSAVS